MNKPSINYRCHKSLTSSLIYLMSGFRDFELIGICPIQPGTAVGLKMPDGTEVCGVYGKEHSIDIEADDRSAKKEQEQIASGLTSVVLFNGIDDVSVMRRMTPEQYRKLVIYSVEISDDDLWL